MKGCHCNQKKCYQCCRGIEEKYFKAVLSGLQEVPLIESPGRGVIKAKLRKGYELEVSGYFEDLETPYHDEIGSHIHLGLAGTNGAVVFTLDPDLSYDRKSGCYNKKKNTFLLTEVQREQLLARQFYVNIHTWGVPSGELRGQLLPKAEKYFVVNLSGDNEVPPVETEATGTLMAELEECNLVLSGVFAGLSAPIDFTILGGAHIHEGSAEENGPVEIVLGLEPNQGLQSGAVSQLNSYALTCEQKLALKKGELYVNIHTLEFPAGELRGQLVHLNEC